MSAAGAGGSGKKEGEDGTPVRAGELLFCGGTSWDGIGRRGADGAGVVLPSPTRLRPLMGVPISYIASGSSSCHCVAIDANGRCFTWGRNDRGQLGVGDLFSRDAPTVLATLAKHKIVKAGAGRHFTVVLTGEGESFAFGCNKHGQLGSGSIKNEVESLPVKSLVSKASHVSCGAEFTVWLTSTPGATILTAGLPQYGQLGHGTDNQYNAKESSVKLVHEPQPRPKAIATLAEKTMTKVACGHNHTVAVDSTGSVYTWGFGGYGRLGHKEQKDEWIPRLVEHFQRQNVLPPTALIAAGSAYSACTAGGGQLFMWGRVKMTGDSWMYPKPVLDLSGWAIRCLDCGERTSFAGAEKSCISWGQATYGELGYGPSGPKSSASAKKVDLLEGMEVVSVACGVGHSLIVVDTSGVEDRIEKLEVYECTAPIQKPTEVKETKVPAHGLKSNDKKRKSVGDVSDDDKQDAAEDGPKDLKARNGEKKSQKSSEAKRSRGRPAKKSAEESSGEEEEEEESDDSEQDDESKGKPRGRGRPRGRGKGSGRGAAAEKEGDPTPTGKRGRGRSVRGR